MRQSRNQTSALLLAVALAGCGGCCAPCCQLSDGCACDAYQCDVLRAIHNVCSCPTCYDCGDQVGCGRGIRVTDDAVWIDEPAPACCLAGGPRLACRPRVERGPPPVGYQPPMPPKFLPVPVHSVFANVNPLAPTPTRGAVEADYGPQLTVPGRD